MKQRDADSAETAYRIKAAVYALPVGIAAAGITFLASQSLFLAMLAFVIVGGTVAVATLWLADRTATVGASLYRPSGSSTPAVREYSYADSLVARGQPAEAIAAYEELSRQYPADPEPRLRRARVLRDKLHQYDDSVRVFRELLLLPGLKPEMELVALREIVEIHLKQDRPQHALPHLARIAEKFAGTPTAEWARAEVRDIKATMKHES